jgi:hypothetical protein
MARLLCDVCAMPLNPGHSKVLGLSHSECVILGLLKGGLLSSCTGDSILKIFKFYHSICRSCMGPDWSIDCKLLRLEVYCKCCNVAG